LSNDEKQHQSNATFYHVPAREQGIAQMVRVIHVALISKKTPQPLLKAATLISNYTILIGLLFT